MPPSAAATVNAPTQPLDPGQYHVRRGAHVFDEHDEHDREGKLARRFDRTSLEEIARRCNERDRRGALCPLTIGHTRDGAPESEQPPIVGYARNFRVSYSADQGRHFLLADFWIHKDHYDLASQYKRVSVELWPKDRILDPIALLRRTPQRDLPQWTYAMHGKHQVIRYAMEERDDEQDPTLPPAAEHDEQGPPPAEGDSSDGGPPPGDEPAPAANPDDPTDEDHRMVDRFARTLRYMCDGHAKKYASATQGPPAFPGNTNAVPGAVPPPKLEDKDTLKMQKAISDSQLERRLKAMEQEVRQLRYEKAHAEARALASQLYYEGKEVDVAAEAKRMAGMNAEQRQAHCDYVRKYHRTREDVVLYGAPLNTGADPLNFDGQGHITGGAEMGQRPRGEGVLTAAEADRAMKYMREKKCSWEQAEEWLLSGGKNGNGKRSA